MAELPRRKFLAATGGLAAFPLWARSLHAQESPKRDLPAKGEFPVKAISSANGNPPVRASLLRAWARREKQSTAKTVRRVPTARAGKAGPRLNLPPASHRPFPRTDAIPTKYRRYTDVGFSAISAVYRN